MAVTRAALSVRTPYRTRLTGRLICWGARRKHRRAPAISAASRAAGSRHPRLGIRICRTCLFVTFQDTQCNAAISTAPAAAFITRSDGAGPFLVFAHGLGGNHLSWWQQVPHFRDRYTCVTFSHRGFAPSSAPPGGPDPADYAGDLAALLDHLGARDVRIVAQSMGGWSALEYRLCAAGPRARAGAGLHRRHDRAAVIAVRRPGADAAAGKRTAAAAIGVMPGEQHPCRRRGSAWRASNRLRISSTGDRRTRAGVDKVTLRRRLLTASAAPARYAAHARAFRRCGSPARRTSSIRRSSPTSWRG